MNNFLISNYVFSFHQLIHFIILFVKVLRYDYRKVNSLRVILCQFHQHFMSICARKHKISCETIGFSILLP